MTPCTLVEKRSSGLLLLFVSISSPSSKGIPICPVFSLISSFLAFWSDVVLLNLSSNSPSSPLTEISEDGILLCQRPCWPRPQWENYFMFGFDHTWWHIVSCFQVLKLTHIWLPPASFLEKKKCYLSNHPSKVLLKLAVCICEVNYSCLSTVLHSSLSWIAYNSFQTISPVCQDYPEFLFCPLVYVHSWEARQMWWVLSYLFYHQQY